jgi:hypothetical protein
MITLMLGFSVVGCSQDTTQFEQLRVENAELKKRQEHLEAKVAALAASKTPPKPQSKEKELFTRLRQLDQDLKALQQQVKKPAPAKSDNQLPGRWSVTTKEDRFNATFTDLTFSGDGTCKYVFGGGNFGIAKYQVIGKKLIISGLPPLFDNKERNEQFLINSLTENELVLDKYRYARVK